MRAAHFEHSLPREITGAQNREPILDPSVRLIVGGAFLNFRVASMLLKGVPVEVERIEATQFLRQWRGAIDVTAAFPANSVFWLCFEFDERAATPAGIPAASAHSR